ncbi:MAG: leucine-rich repeat domain-containing protein, partial [Tannerella sp.]|nr:leucine-rich repeat domain-containing protein [Tannerella sp.]
WIDEFGVKYSADRKKLISCPYNCNLTTYTINAGCEVICDKAFYGCSRLTTLIIPNSVKAIGEMAFLGCNNLTTIYVSWEDPTIVSGLIHFPDKAVFYLPYGIRVDWYKRMGMKTATARLTELHPINSVTE